MTRRNAPPIGSHCGAMLGQRGLRSGLGTGQAGVALRRNASASRSSSEKPIVTHVYAREQARARPESCATPETTFLASQT
jgi:hypothetical protein